MKELRIVYMRVFRYVYLSNLPNFLYRIFSRLSGVFVTHSLSMRYRSIYSRSIYSRSIYSTNVNESP